MGFDTAERFRRCVYLKYNGMLYNNMKLEAERAAEAHIKKMQKEIDPNVAKRYGMGF